MVMKNKNAIAAASLAVLTYFGAGCSEEMPWSMKPSTPVKQSCAGSAVEDITEVDAKGSVADYRDVCKKLNYKGLEIKSTGKLTSEDSLDVSLQISNLGEKTYTEALNVRYINCVIEQVGGWRSWCSIRNVPHTIKGPFTKGKTIEDKLTMDIPGMDKNSDQTYIIQQVIVYSDTEQKGNVGKVGSIIRKYQKK